MSSKLPAMWPSSSTPASSARPPPVTVRAILAPLRASERLPQKPMSRNEDRLVSSQKSIISKRFSASTTPSMEPMNSSRKAKKRPIGLVRRVVAGVEDHQQADAEDQQGEEETEAVQAQAEVDADFRQPGIAGGQGLPGEHRAALSEQQDQADQRRHAGGRRAQGAAARSASRGNNAPMNGSAMISARIMGYSSSMAEPPACLAGGASRGCRCAAGSPAARSPIGHRQAARRNYDYRNLSNERHGLNYYKIQAFRLPESRKNSATATT